MSTEPRQLDAQSTDGQIGLLNPRASVGLSCESFESELFKARAEFFEARAEFFEAAAAADPQRSPADFSRSDLPLTKSQADHVAHCVACRRELEEGAFTGALGVLAQEPKGADPLFLPGVLAAIRDERAPIRQRERRLRHQWLAGSACILICILFVNVFVLTSGETSPRVVNSKESAEALPRRPSVPAAGSGENREGIDPSIVSFTPSAPERAALVGSADVYLLGYASEYLPCEFIPSGEPRLGDLTEIKF